MQPSIKKRFTRILPTVVLHSAILGIYVAAARRYETAVEGVVLAKLGTCCEKNLLALTHALFTQPVRFMQLGASSRCLWSGLSPNRRRTKGYERITSSQSNNMPTINHSNTMNTIISFNPNGTAQCLWTDAIPLHEFGRLQITRASNIEFNNGTQQWEVRDGKGKVRFIARSRSACLEWEQQNMQPG
jgi:hypothetical protein